MMGTAERRRELLKILCRRRHETMKNLASEFGVSQRTIQRDIELLSCSEPIYTQPGKYGGGVYVVEGYTMDRMYMTDAEIGVLQKIYLSSDRKMPPLTPEDKSLLRSIISQYSKPKINQERKSYDRT